ncbi:hypothetical protein H257_18933 [Aphanomyces astaci]|uniref:Uncharacterized protein n=1 Tax=Aphanomyces astaci TaxID=112090 RepID=W4F9H4_APHAT|nr:hypothetical protein H257_18933 [Aphanomyces astaci]ETV64135.1 hypothetical protein H257_18933 [Aphanomyces astaci]|eukprot:XP_009846382.1 hypothetical protein H257_18933 [Aphanomyces astaci]
MPTRGAIRAIVRARVGGGGRVLSRGESVSTAIGSMALSCANEVMSVFREAIHHDNDAVRMRWLAPMVAQFEHVPVGKDVDPLTVNEAGPEHKCIQYKLFHGGVHKRTEKNAFLKQFMDGHWSTLDKTMLRFVGGSALVLRMGGPALDRAIRGVVVYLLALQVASDGGAELDPSTNPKINSLSPSHFQRQLSGPQTQFDMLYSEM